MADSEMLAARVQALEDLERPGPRPVACRVL